MNPATTRPPAAATEPTSNLRIRSLEPLVPPARLCALLPLDATARFLAAPKLERFVAATVERSIEFLNGRTQRD